jgi:hypothetical protein
LEEALAESDKLALIGNIAASYLRRNSVSIDQIGFQLVGANGRIGECVTSASHCALDIQPSSRKSAFMCSMYSTWLFEITLSRVENMLDRLSMNRCALSSNQVRQRCTLKVVADRLNARLPTRQLSKGLATRCPNRLPRCHRYIVVSTRIARQLFLNGYGHEVPKFVGRFSLSMRKEVRPHPNDSLNIESRFFDHGVPREWAEGAARLFVMPSPSNATPNSTARSS